MAYAGKVGETRRLRTVPNSVPVNTSRPMSALATGITIGVLVGAAVALLFAPARGKDTRRLLRRGMRRVGLRSHDAWEDLRLELQHARRQLKRARRRAKLAVGKAGVEAAVDTAQVVL
jgi:gas vesicle protein